MDAGRFECVSAPYAFNTTLRSLFVPLRLAAETRGLELIVDLDKNIDLVARKALYEARGEPPELVAARLRSDGEDEALVVGDEMRLRQITTNLASNATKFTPAGGQITITTKLIHPAPSPTSSDTDSTKDTEHTTLVSEHAETQPKLPEPLEDIIIRLEVRDTGFGIRPRDLRDNKVRQILAELIRLAEFPCSCSAHTSNLISGSFKAERAAGSDWPLFEVSSSSAAVDLAYTVCLEAVAVSGLSCRLASVHECSISALGSLPCQRLHLCNSLHRQTISGLSPLLKA